MSKKAYIKVKDGILKSKTTCFTISDDSDRYPISVTLDNKLILG
jgi:hypothetical protein